MPLRDDPALQALIAGVVDAAKVAALEGTPPNADDWRNSQQGGPAIWVQSYKLIHKEAI
jgi:hypothetical protein